LTLRGFTNKFANVFKAAEQTAPAVTCCWK